METSFKKTIKWVLILVVLGGMKSEGLSLSTTKASYSTPMTPPSISEATYSTSRDSVANSFASFLPLSSIKPPFTASNAPFSSTTSPLPSIKSTLSTTPTHSYTPIAFFSTASSSFNTSKALVSTSKALLSTSITPPSSSTYSLSTSKAQVSISKHLLSPFTSLLTTSTAQFSTSTAPRSSSPISSPLSPEAPTASECWEEISSLYQNRSPHPPRYLSLCSLFCGGDLTFAGGRGEWAKLITESGGPASSCLRESPDFGRRITQDVFWLTSEFPDFPIYLGNSSDVALNWDYLSGSQKALEVFILVVLVLGVVVGTVGNVLVLLTMVWSCDKHDHWWYSRASLAASDLLKALFVMTLAVSDIGSLMNGSFPFTATEESQSITEHESWFFAPRSGYASFCSFILGLTTTVSLENLAWLSFERFLLCSGKTQYLNTTKVKAAVWIMWFSAVAGQFFILFDNKYRGISYFDPISKLTLLLPCTDCGLLSRVLSWFTSLFFTLLFLFTVIVSVIALRVFKANATDEMVELVQISSLSRIRRQGRNDSRIILTMGVMLVTYILSTTSLFLMLLLPGKLSPPVHFFVCWIFVLSASWNWYVYNLRSDFFRSRLAGLISRLPWLPVPLEIKLKRMMLPSSMFDMDSGFTWNQLQILFKRQEIDV